MLIDKELEEPEFGSGRMHMQARFEAVKTRSSASMAGRTCGCGFKVPVDDAYCGWMRRHCRKTTRPWNLQSRDPDHGYHELPLLVKDRRSRPPKGTSQGKIRETSAMMRGVGDDLGQPIETSTRTAE